MPDTTRRQFLRYGAGASALLALPLTARQGLSRAQITRSRRTARAAPGGVSLRPFCQPLPVPGNGIVVAAPSGTNRYAFTQRPIARQLHPHLPPTPLWAYDDGSGLSGQAGSFGMVLAAQSGTPIDVSFTNELPDTYPAWLPVDTRLTDTNGAHVRPMTHLHGGFVAADSDGNPVAGAGAMGYAPRETQRVHYSNELPQMPASLRWFHDHGMGTTRLNVFAGLAAGYLIHDEHDTGTEPNPIGVPGGGYEVPLVIQDRMFNPDGTLQYPVSDIAGVTWIGEYFGDHMLVNGKVWPYLDVEPRMYRFRILNGCNARIMSLRFGGLPMWQIGAEGGLFDEPVRVSALVLAPAERADVLVDFARLAGRTLLLRNDTPAAPVSTPAPALVPVMQIRVGTSVTHRAPRKIPSSLPGQRPRLPRPRLTRYISLNEVGADTAGWYLNLNGVDFDAAPVTETPKAGTVEDWVWVNTTGDTHPMHVHLVTFQVVGRTPYDAAAYQAKYGGPAGVPGGISPEPFATGPRQPPTPDERGFKDTVKANPGFFTTIRARFDLPKGVTGPQEYVHHCHIVEHEDNEMMRPFTVVP
jgi:spore coat protein A, manganese oxidase